MQLRQPRHNQHNSVRQHQYSAEEPDRYLSSFTHNASIQLYQKIKFRMKKIVITMHAQKIGFCQTVVAPSSGIGVAP